MRSKITFRVLGYEVEIRLWKVIGFALICLLLGLTFWPQTPSNPGDELGYAVFPHQASVRGEPGRITVTYIALKERITRSEAHMLDMVAFVSTRDEAAQAAGTAADNLLVRLRTGDFSSYPGATRVDVGMDAGPEYPAGGDYVDKNELNNP